MQGIPATMSGVLDVRKESKVLLKQGVKLTIDPTKIGEHTIAVFDDICGNLIQVIEQK